MTKPDPLARFWDRHAKGYAAKPVADQAVYEEKLKRTVALLKPYDRLLEIGCGTGTTAMHLAPHVAHITGLDISPNMVQIAREKSAHTPNTSFEVTNVDSLPDLPESVDVVLAHSILHLVNDPLNVLNQVAKRLKPGGYLVSTTACIADFMPWFKYLVPVGARLGLLPYVHVFSKEDLLDWHNQSGFTVVDQWQPKPRSGLFLISKLQTHA